MKIILTIFIIIISILIPNLTKIKNTKIQNERNIFINDLNESIIDGFFDGDTTNKNMSNVYFIK